MKGRANNRELREYPDTFVLFFIRAAVMIFACAALTLFSAPRAAALELSLEENKGESGTIGYVDIDRVFKDFSGTSNAREEFLTEIKKKEDALNIKKQAIFSLKADIAKLKQEHAFALTLPGLMRQAEEISAAVAKAAENASPQISTQTANDANPQIATSTAAVQSSTQTTKAANPQISVADSASGPRQASVTVADSANGPRQTSVTTSTAAVQLSTRTVKAATPQISTGAVQVNISTADIASGTALGQINGPTIAVNAILISTASSTADEVFPSTGQPGLAGIDMPGISRVPLNYFKFSVSTSAAEIDVVITAKEAELSKKEEELRQAQHRTERELLEYETHKSEIILGRIYLALKELAVKEGVSVVVDKRNILFGHSAVDLTDKLIKKLEESPI